MPLVCNRRFLAQISAIKVNILRGCRGVLQSLQANVEMATKIG
jgi:hypothetical protein